MHIGIFAVYNSKQKDLLIPLFSAPTPFLTYQYYFHINKLTLNYFCAEITKKRCYTLHCHELIKKNLSF